MKIYLSQGKYTIIDDSDYELIKNYVWYYGSRQYAVSKSITGKDTFMHRVIMNCNNPNQYVDHINGDSLDNRRSNLRLCTIQENNCNRSKQAKASTSKYKGVHKMTGRDTYSARIAFNGVRISLGIFLSEKEAALAYNKRAVEIHGEFAKLNIIEE